MTNRENDNLIQDIERDEAWFRSIAGEGPEPDSLEYLRFLVHAEVETQKLGEFPSPQPSEESIARCKAAFRQAHQPAQTPLIRWIPWAATAAAAAIILVILPNISTRQPVPNANSQLVASTESSLDDFVEIMDNDNWENRWQAMILKSKLDVISEEYVNDVPENTIQDESFDEIDGRIDDLYDSLDQQQDSMFDWDSAA